MISAAEVVSFIYGHGPVSVQDIMKGFALPRRARKEIDSLLDGLCLERILDRPSARLFTLHEHVNLLEGVIAVHPRGFAFATVDAKQAGKLPRGVNHDQDLFIPAGALADARHGDRVLLRIIGKRRGRGEAVVVRVLSRSTSRLVGIFTQGKASGFVTPEDDRFPFVVLVHKEQSMGAQNGEAVVVEISDQSESTASDAVPVNPRGVVSRVLGDPDDMQVQTDIVIEKFALPHEFGDKVRRQLERLGDNAFNDAGREDLRDILHVTIDGESARDFDDAVAVLKTRKGYRLFVSIADVGYYVPEGSPLDKEAYRRGTSVYFPDRVVPMLPERLADDLCSLLPDRDRPAFTAVLDFDRSGGLLKKRFAKSVIRSRYRLTYKVVRQIIVDRDPRVRGEYKALLTPLKWMAELADQLERVRKVRGSIGFEIPEAEIDLADDGRISAIIKKERNKAHKLIEEFMLAANEAVAATLNSAGIPFLFRIHEAPDPLKVAEFVEFAQGMGLDVPVPVSASPGWFSEVLARAAGTRQEYLVSNLLLRAMKQACYSPDNVGHFGLAAPCYTHFTSPIRRYPDLTVHRRLADLIAGRFENKSGDKDRFDAASSLKEKAGFLSLRERTAVEAEREMLDRLKVRFMADKLGMEFQGVISGVSPFAVFVELLDYFISGAAVLEDLKGDYYQYDEKKHRIVGKHTNKILQLGRQVRVRVKDVDPRRRHIDFTILE